MDFASPMPEKKPVLPVAVTCECTVSYHYEKLPNGNMVAVMDQPLPAFSTMMWGRCERCGLPYHTEFSNGEPV